MNSKGKMSLEEATIKALYNELPVESETSDVTGLIDDVLVITDPYITSEEYDEVIDRAQEIVETTPEGEIPLDDEYIGQIAQTCPICGSTFVEDHILQPGETCPVCLEEPEGFVVVGKLEAEDTVIEHEKDIDIEEEKEDTVEEESTTSNQEFEDDTTELEKALSSVQITGNKLTESTEEVKLQETGEWDDNDEEMQASLEEMKYQAQELASQINGEVKTVKGFDKYQGPFAIISTPKHGDVKLWFDGEDSNGNSFICEIAHEGNATGGINDIAEVLNKEELTDMDIIKENKKEDKLIESMELYTDEAAAVYEYIQEEMSDEQRKELYKQHCGELEDMEHFWDWIESLNSDELEELVELPKEEAQADKELDMKKTMKAESITADEVTKLHEDIENAEDMEEIQSIIYSISDNSLENEAQLAYDQCVADNDELDAVKDFVIATIEDNAEYLEESYSEKLGGDPEDFITDISNVRAALNNLLQGSPTYKLSTHLAEEMLESFIEVCDAQIEMTKNKYELKEDYSVRLGGDPEDFITDVSNILVSLNAFKESSTFQFATHLAEEIVDSFISTCKSQIEMTKNKYNIEEA